MIVKDSCKCLYSDVFKGVNGAVVSVYAGRFKDDSYENPVVYFVDVTERRVGTAKTYRVVLANYKRVGTARDSRCMLLGVKLLTALRYPFPTVRGVIEHDGYIEAVAYATAPYFEGRVLND